MFVWQDLITTSCPILQCSYILFYLRHIGRIGSNSGSARIDVIVKPQCSYSLHIVCIFCVMVCSCLLSRASTVPNLMSLEMVTRNGILFVNIMSIHNVTFPCMFSKSGGMPSIYLDTCGLGQWMVLPLSEPRLGPIMSSAARTS